MNYQNIYKSLITKRQKNPAKGYTEKHHILPKSLGGSDGPSNLVVLTGREHWVAHLLLYKIHKNRQMAFACHMMTAKCEERGIAYIKSSRLYEAVRIEIVKLIKVAQKGKGNSQYNTMWICNNGLKENKKISKDDDIPEGWIKGRNKWNDRQCIKCGKGFKGIGKIVHCSRRCSATGRSPSDETRKKQSKTMSKPRPYRVGLKYKK